MRLTVQLLPLSGPEELDSGISIGVEPTSPSGVVSPLVDSPRLTDVVGCDTRTRLVSNNALANIVGASSDTATEGPVLRIPYQQMLSLDPPVGTSVRPPDHQGLAGDAQGGPGTFDSGTAHCARDIVRTAVGWIHTTYLSQS